MNAQTYETELIKMRASLNKIAEFVALYESTEDKLQIREKEIEERISNNERAVDTQLSQIKSVLNDFREIMTEAGAARWRVAADQSLKSGQQHLKSIRLATDEFVRKTEDNYKKLDKTAEYTVKGISKAIYSFRIDDFQRITKDAVTEIQAACDNTLKKIERVVRWFHWRNVGLLFAMTLVLSLVSGLYLNDEWPWEAHRDIMDQRQLAHAVVSAWPHLTKLDQQTILNSADHSVS